MATANYNEVTHTNMTIDNMDPMFHWDTHYPDRFSRHAGLSLTPETSPGRRQRRMRSRCDARYKTQPITFDEIQEVDEEGNVPGSATEESKEGLKSQFTAFSRSMDGLVPGFPFSKQVKALSDCKKKEVQSSRVPDSGTPTTDDQTPEREEVAATEATGNAESDPSLQLASLPSSLQNRDHDRRRRKQRRSQRRNKSIEEIPESGERQDEDKPAG